MQANLSTLGLYQNTIQNAIQVQSQIATIQQQVSSGTKAQDFEGLNGQVQLYVSLENQLAKAGQYSANNTVLQSRLNTTSQTLGQVISTANQALNLMLQARNGSEANSLAFDQQMKSFFQTIAGQLNTQSGGAYLFSGTRTDQPPVDPTQYPTTVQLGVPDTGYYHGNSQNITSAIADSTVITTNVRADDPGIQKIMAAFAAAKVGFDNGDDQTLQQAYNLMQQGIAGVTQTQASVDASSQQVSHAQTISDTQVTYWKTLKDNTVSADLVSLSTQLSADQGVLQASFQVFARINSLHLSNYLSTTG
ncbi:MAG: hypothetical protein JO089_02000 [Alphaproteobacteria bacterium]|nr:hypothetical protein [Alphaproteobacteria bacterium]